MNVLQRCVAFSLPWTAYLLSILNCMILKQCVFCFSTNNKNRCQLHLNSTPLILIFSQSYLKNFFNLTEERGPGTRSRISPLTRKLSEMQRFFGLQITGTLDDDTIKMMKKPRCGVPDGKLAHFSTFGRNLKWEKQRLTYR